MCPVRTHIQHHRALLAHLLRAHRFQGVTVGQIRADETVYLSKTRLAQIADGPPRGEHALVG
jgi:hypothetical protein